MRWNVIRTYGSNVIHPGPVLWVIRGRLGRDGRRAWGRDCNGGRNKYTGREGAEPGIVV